MSLAAGARFTASAMACADSSAGMMPSVRESRTAASRASPSEIGRVLGAAPIVKLGVFRTDHGIVEARRHGMRQRDLAVRILQHVAVGALQHAGSAPAETRGMLAGSVTAAAGFDPYQLHVVIRHERVENSDGVAASAHAGKDRIGQPALRFQNLAARLLADHLLEIAHHHRVRMRAQRRAQQVIRVADVGHPVAHGLADGVL